MRARLLLWLALGLSSMVGPASCAGIPSTKPIPLPQEGFQMVVQLRLVDNQDSLKGYCLSHAVGYRVEWNQPLLARACPSPKRTITKFGDREVVTYGDQMYIMDFGRGQDEPGEIRVASNSGFGSCVAAGVDGTLGLVNCVHHPNRLGRDFYWPGDGRLIVATPQHGERCVGVAGSPGQHDGQDRQGNELLRRDLVLYSCSSTPHRSLFTWELVEPVTGYAIP